MKKITLFLLLSLSALGWHGSGLTDDVTVVKATAIQVADNTYRFNVTLLHKDEGWNHYANQWQVFTPDGTLLGTRTLHHPHEHEQPFTRSLNNVLVPADVTEVLIRARDSVHGESPVEYILKLPKNK